jgi:hypothetical protein
LDADGRALTNGLGCEALMKTLRVLLRSHPDPKGVEILEVMAIRWSLPLFDPIEMNPANV